MHPTASQTSAIRHERAYRPPPRGSPRVALSLGSAETAKINILPLINLVDLRWYTSGTHQVRKRPSTANAVNARSPANTGPPTFFNVSRHAVGYPCRTGPPVGRALHV